MPWEYVQPAAPGVLPVPLCPTRKLFPQCRGPLRHRILQGLLKPGKSRRKRPQPTQPPQEQRKTNEPTVTTVKETNNIKSKTERNAVKTGKRNHDRKKNEKEKEAKQEVTG
ncbi:hypothetical protein NDU88_001342 [Pleurodeles waltl]|uniref:Uncharacterized protein n=1 Tax=Pleurodeles waltl TaxID=8319 RepID=A0AAV7SBC6_PLEWA|nr:hypothetical protein NDU88_001342 [Pleurodeles waltl]